MFFKQIFIEIFVFRKICVSFLLSQMVTQLTVNFWIMAICLFILNKFLPYQFVNNFSQLLEFPLVDYYLTNSSSLIFSFANNETQRSWEGFQGFVTYESAKPDGCPLANKNEPFVFTNESEVLYLRSSYIWNLEFDIRNWQEKECIWKFLAPEGYTFKIVSLFADSKVLVVANDKRQYIQR